MDGGGFEANDLPGNLADLFGLANGQEITLIDARVVGSKSWGKTIFEISADRQVIRPQAVIVGCHRKSSELNFKNFQFSTENFHGWCGQTVLSAHMPPRSPTGDVSWTIAGHVPQDLSAKTPFGEFHLDHTLSSTDPRVQRQGSTSSLSAQCRMKVKPSSPAALQETQQVIFQVQQLIGLLAAESSGLLWVQATLAPSSENSLESPIPKREDRRVDIYYRPSLLGGSGGNEISHAKFLLTCSDIPFQELIPTWFELIESVRAGVGSLLGVINSPGSFVESNLSSIAGAAEALHRKLGSQTTRISNPEYKALRASIRKAISAENADWVLEGLHNAPSLRDRLLSLAQLPDSSAVGSFLPDTALWAVRTTKARNELAHEGETKNHSLDELDAIVDLTKALLILVLLSKLGLPHDAQRAAVDSHPVFERARRSAGELRVEQ